MIDKSDPGTTEILLKAKRGRGRPRKADALTQAQRAATYRQRRAKELFNLRDFRAAGLKMPADWDAHDLAHQRTFFEEFREERHKMGAHISMLESKCSRLDERNAYLESELRRVEGWSRVQTKDLIVARKELDALKRSLAKKK